MVQGNVAMANPSSSRPDSSTVGESPRPPTFVRIDAPVSGIRRKMLVVLGVGVALTTALGWTAYRLMVEPAAPVAMQAAPTVAEVPPPQPAPADLDSELARLTINTAASEPVWRRESLMDRISPFDASVPDRQVPSGPSPADTPNAMQDGSYEVSVRLGRGDTIGSALQKLGFEAKAIADAVSAVAPHVRLKRLPIGLGMTLQIRPPEQEGAKPILQALTLQPEGRQQVTVERTDEGRYVVELPDRSTAR
jgi:hypothetical protein